MKINNERIAKLGAEIIDKKIYLSSFEKEVQYEDNMLKPIVLKKKFKLGYMEIRILFKAVTEQDLYLNISEFNYLVQECVINFMKEDEIFYEDIFYKCVLEKNEPIEKPYLDILDNMYTVETFCTLDILYKYKAEVTELLNRITSKTINVEGNKVIPAIIEITPSVAMSSLTIIGLGDNIIINNLEATKKVIFNENSVTVNGINKFGDCDLWDFPRLKPGENTITIDKDTCDITIKYTPMWI